jgi:phospholipid/cholesterol/gamma-HCH transport system ATP-binding protein
LKTMDAPTVSAAPATQMISPEPVIVIEQLCKTFGTRVILDRFDLSVGKQENVVVLGRSGAGKSVLIKCIIGLLTPDSGDILVFNKDVPKLDHLELDKMRAKVGFLFQNNALYDSMTIRQNLEFPLKRHWIGLTRQDVNDRVMDALNSVGLADTVDMMPGELSGGMAKRIALARTLILKPEIILYDEPTTGLDPITAKEISELIVDLQKRFQTTSIVISHDMHCVKLVADRIAVLINGRCHADGTYRELEQSTEEEVRGFFE